jgi:CBS domain-containing protein
VASLERMPDKPWQELLVALAGPLVNVVIALALLPGILWPLSTETLTTLAQPTSSPRAFLASVAAVNVWLVLFNLIPAFPMDGGRVLRAILAMFTDRVAATRAAAAVGQGIAVVMAILGIFAGLPLLLILAIFVFLGAGAESAGTQATELLRGLRVSEVMVRSFRALDESDTLATAVGELLANSQTDFPVTRSGSDRSPVVGLLTRSDLIRSLAEKGPSATVREAMREPCPAASPSDSAQSAFDRLRAGTCPVIPVVDDGTLVGLLTFDNISEAIMVRNALGRRATHPAQARTAIPS